MKVPNNALERLKGYFDALDDINGGQREFTTVVSLIHTKNNNILDEIQLSSRNISMENLEITKRTRCDNIYGIGCFLKTLLFSKPFSGLYPPWDIHSIPSKILEQYSNYSIGHIEDNIDSIFHNEGVGIREQRDVELLLLRSKEEYFITLTIKSKEIKILLFFYRKVFLKDDFLELFNSMLNCCPTKSNRR